MSDWKKSGFFWKDKLKISGGKNMSEVSIGRCAGFHWTIKIKCSFEVLDECKSIISWYERAIMEG